MEEEGIEEATFWQGLNVLLLLLDAEVISCNCMMANIEALIKNFYSICILSGLKILQKNHFQESGRKSAKKNYKHGLVMGNNSGISALPSLFSWATCAKTKAR